MKAKSAKGTSAKGTGPWHRQDAMGPVPLADAFAFSPFANAHSRPTLALWGLLVPSRAAKHRGV